MLGYSQQRDKRPLAVQLVKMLDCQLHATIARSLDKIAGRQQFVLRESQRELEHLNGLNLVLETFAPGHGQRHPPRPHGLL